MKKNVLWLLIGLVVLSVLTSYVHRYFVGNSAVTEQIPVITDGVIPAIQVDTASAAS